MIINEIVQKFLQSPPYLNNGAGFLAKKWNCTKEEIKEARGIARNMLKQTSTFNQEDFIPTPCIPKSEMLDLNTFDCDAQPKYVGSDQSVDGVTKRFESSNPLTPKEIEDLAGVDNITTFIARVWDKLLPNGKWVYSIDIRFRIKDFYNSTELQEKLRELMPDLEPVWFPVNKALEPANKALVICLADDHVGAINVTNLFDHKLYSYSDRLDKVFDEIMDLGQSFDEVHIISLGDQMNGWSSQTTRGGHEVKSLSNKEQFDEYVSARVAFYDKVFTSQISENYFVHDVENSNHSGLGMSYMANKAIEMYLDGKYPQVFRESITEAIGGFQYGEHVVVFGHGKDEKFQKRPMPATLNAQTDLYLYDYIGNKGYTPYKNHITFYKGDLHQLGFQMAKFGRYVNVQSIAGHSDYGDLNFGNTKGGALLEILHKDSYRITSQPIWF